jgi:hypothetical protein
MTPDRKLDDTYLMDAVIVGHLDSHFGMGCFGPKYHLTNARVERIFAVRRFHGDSEEVIKWYKSNSY